MVFCQDFGPNSFNDMGPSLNLRVKMYSNYDYYTAPANSMRQTESNYYQRIL